MQINIYLLTYFIKSLKGRVDGTLSGLQEKNDRNTSLVNVGGPHADQYIHSQPRQSARLPVYFDEKAPTSCENKPKSRVARDKRRRHNEAADRKMRHLQSPFLSASISFKN